MKAMDVRISPTPIARTGRGVRSLPYSGTATARAAMSVQTTVCHHPIASCMASAMTAAVHTVCQAMEAKR